MGATGNPKYSPYYSHESDETTKQNEKPKSNWFEKLTISQIAIILLLISLTIAGYKKSRRSVEIQNDLPYARDDEEFLKLVPETYDEADLVEWEPAPPPISKPDEPGDLGGPVVVPPELKVEADNRFKEHEFNIIANEMMSLNRTLADSRYPECVEVEYPKKLPQVSVIIVFHNEAWSTLIRTVWSVITQSPRALLKEIILVDDFSTKPYLEKQLYDYIKTLPVKTIAAKTLSRVGLIQARLLGASKAKAKVMVFLDAHCECNQGWLEPLLAPIVKSRTTVVAPIIDVINMHDMSLATANINTRGAFDLSVAFAWHTIPEEIMQARANDRTSEIVSPAMAGGLFAIDREYFYNVGSYDELQMYWGGENIEMSLRIWTCGGRLISMPCSRVGHIFRANSPYELPGGAGAVVNRNTARTVDVWFDEYKKVYYSVFPDALSRRTNTTQRKLLRKQLKCKSFQWYLDNVYTDSPFNFKNTRIGEIRSAEFENMCLDSMGYKSDNRTVEAQACHGIGGNQIFLITEKNEIREKQFCLDATVPGAPVKVMKCHGLQGNQKWTYDEKTRLIRHSFGRNCLTLQEESDALTIDKCDGSDAQLWDFVSTNPKLDDLN